MAPWNLQATFPAGCENMSRQPKNESYLKSHSASGVLLQQAQTQTSIYAGAQPRAGKTQTSQT